MLQISNRYFAYFVHKMPCAAWDVPGRKITPTHLTLRSSAVLPRHPSWAAPSSEMQGQSRETRVEEVRPGHRTANFPGYKFVFEGHSFYKQSPKLPRLCFCVDMRHALLYPLKCRGEAGRLGGGGEAQIPNSKLAGPQRPQLLQTLY